MTTTQKQQSYFIPFIVMVVLMSLIGLITSLNQQFQAPMQAAYLIKTGTYTNTFTTLLVFAFFLAYLVMGNVCSAFIDKNGYKKTLLTGLVILIAAFGLYELSAYVFDTIDFPNFKTVIDEAKNLIALYDPNSKEASLSTMQSVAAESGNFGVNISTSGEFKGLTYLQAFRLSFLPTAYWIFLLAAFVAGTALTFLQSVVNPYIVACDVKGTSGVQRQSISGAGNSVMTTIGPLLVAYLIFKGKEGLEINITSLYIPLLVLILLVAIIVFVLKGMDLPDIAGTLKKKGEVLPDSVWSFSHLKLGVIAIFFYVGVEVCVGANINLFAMGQGFTLKTAANMAFFYWGGMLVGRLCGSFLSKVSANFQLAVTSIGAAALLILSIITRNPWILVGVGLFHSIMWPAIFALAIEGLGRYTSKGSGALMMGVVGGAVLPLVQGSLADVLGSWTWTWLIVIAGEVYLLFYALSGYKVLKRDTVVEEQATA